MMELLATSLFGHILTGIVFPILFFVISMFFIMGTLNICSSLNKINKNLTKIAEELKSSNNNTKID